MNLLTTLSEAISSANAIERESNTILGLCRGGGRANSTRYLPYPNYLRRRDRNRRAA